MAKAKRARKAKPRTKSAMELMSEHADPTLRLVAAAFDLRKPYAMSLAEQHLRHYRAEEVRQTRLAERYKALADALDQTGDIVVMAHAIMEHRPKAMKATERAKASGSSADAIEAVMAAFGRQSQTWREDDGETPEARVYASREIDPIMALEMSGKLTKGQAGNAREIAMIFQAVTRALFAKSGSLGAGGGGGRGTSDIVASLALKHKHRYKPWLLEVERNAIPLPFLIEIIIDGYALSAASDHHRMSHATGLEKLRRALILYGRIRKADPTDYERAEELAV